MHPVDGLGLTNVGHVYVWPIKPGEKNQRQAWQLQARGKGYVFYNDFDGGQWLSYRKEDDCLICVNAQALAQTPATEWNISPAPDPALLKGTIP